jgi:hypothetical protein
MGSFLLQRQGSSIEFNLSDALKAFKDQGLITHKTFAISGWTLYGFTKQLTPYDNFYIGDQLKVFVFGTIILPGKLPGESVKAIHSFYSRNNRLPENLTGSYFLIIDDYERVQFFADQENIYNIFYSEDFTTLSSSFLALCEGLNFFHINRQAIIENLCTGSLIGPETIVSEIFRYEPHSINQTDDFAIQKAQSNALPIPEFKNRKDSLQAQIEILDEYFLNLKPAVMKYGLDSGLTGGFDSRLLMAMIKRHYSGCSHQFHSHKRKNPGPEYLIAKELCEITESPFIDQNIQYPNDLNESEMNKVLEHGLQFYDGQIRTHAFWHEAYNSLHYRKNIMGSHGLGFHGIGGEQYRNFERFHANHWKLDKWVQYGLIRKMGGSRLLPKKSELDLSEIITQKIRSRLQIGNKLSQLSLKRYMNEIYIPANRGVRTSMENKLSFFLVPFADHKVSTTAYGAIPFLGLSLNYQADLIRMIDPLLASVNSDYGFDFLKGEPIKKYYPLIIAENLLPWSLWLIIQSKFKNPSGKIQWVKLVDQFKGLQELKNCVDSYDFGFDSQKVLQSPDLGPLIFSLGYFLQKYEVKIKA